jgi:Fic family protein
MKKPLPNKISEFIYESNLIENVRGAQAQIDAEKAFKFALEQKKIDIASILEIHHLLMEHLNPRIAGHFRHCDVWIGGHKKKFITVYLFHENLQDVCDLMNYTPAMCKEHKAEGKVGKENIAEAAHIMFEDIHPFEDGNGRVGRILWNWHRLKMGLPIKIIHHGEEQMSYYDWFSD